MQIVRKYRRGCMPILDRELSVGGPLSKRVSRALVDAAIERYFCELARMEGVQSSASPAFLQSTSGPRTTTENPRETACLRFARVSRVVKHCSKLEIAALRVKYWAKRGNIILSQRGDDGVLVPITKAVAPSDTACARSIGLTTPKQFRKVLGSAKRNVAKSIEDISKD